jgi:hypothetical protein
MPSQKAQFAHANVKSGNFSPLFSNAREKNGSASFFPSHLKTGRKTLLDARGTKLLLPQEVKLFSLDFCQDLGSLRSVKNSKSTGCEKSSGNCKNPLDFGELNGP